jgi:tetratricopeptide (TPR) repeat protein
VNSGEHADPRITAMKLTPRLLPTLLALATACATATTATTAGAAPDPQRYKQVDFRYPPDTRAFDDDIERGFLGNILTHHQTAIMAQTAGNMDQARAEWAAEARALVEFCEKFPSNDYRVVFRYQAAKLYWYAQQGEAAAEQAEKVTVDPAAAKKSRAAASRLAAAAWLGVAFAKAKAGTLDKIVLPTAEQRRDRPLAPRSPPGEWKRFVLAADAYAEVAADDPDKDKPVNERLVSVTTAELAMRAGQIQYAFDNMEDARARFEKVIQSWPGDVEALEGAVPLYLQTFAVLKDDAGAAAALARVREVVTASAAKATEPKAKEGFAKVLEVLARQEGAVAFANAQKLLDEGKPAAAAAIFEQLAASTAGSQDSAAFLNNAAVAWDQAGQADKASALRERLVAEFPDSKVTPAALLTLAGSNSKAGRHEAARALYQDYLTKFPDGGFRCGAIQNLGVELEALKKPIEAAAQYQVFGADARCAAEDYNATVKLVFRAAELFAKGGKKAEAKEAYGTVVKVGGSVTDVVSKSLVTESKKRLKGP